MNFKNCTLHFLEKQFQLEQVYDNHHLHEWLNKQTTISETKHHRIQKLQRTLMYNVVNWNEMELVANFIGPLFSLVDFHSKKFNYFMGRDIGCIVEEMELKGKPDGIVASGHRQPEAPYFCFHEYKREVDSAGDPIGQVLAAMLVAQEIHRTNNKQWDKPIYGCYVIGRNWYFMILDDKQYMIGNGYDAVTEDIFDIFRILLALKEIVVSYVQEK